MKRIRLTLALAFGLAGAILGTPGHWRRAVLWITAIVLVDYTAMSGAIGGGGLGDLAIRYGYHRFQTEVMLICVLVLILLVQLIQASGNRLVTHFSRR